MGSSVRNSRACDKKNGQKRGQIAVESFWGEMDRRRICDDR